MISSKTLNIDNPKLTCRLKGYDNFSPKRIIIDKNLNMKLKSYIFKSEKQVNTHNSYKSYNHSSHLVIALFPSFHSVFFLATPPPYLSLLFLHIHPRPSHLV